MCSVMREKMAEFGFKNISVVQKRWEDVDVEKDLQPPYDVVVASFSLGMQDIRAAILKMMQASSRYVYLYHFAGPTTWDLQWQELWPKMHGRPYQPGPKCDVLYNVLYQMGIYPHCYQILFNPFKFGLFNISKNPIFFFFDIVLFYF
jgi:hypothetical protein